MDALYGVTGGVSDELLIDFFRRKKTQLSTMKQPTIFLCQLRDYDLVPEELFQEVLKVKSKNKIQENVYKILEWVESKGGDSVKDFWKCVFKDHMLDRYPDLLLIRNGFFDVAEKTRKTPEQNTCAPEGQKSSEESNKEEPGPSSAPSQKRAATTPSLSNVSNEQTLPVICGKRNGVLYPTKLAKGEKCISSQGSWYFPGGFEKASGKGSSQKWKHSIRYNNIPLGNLIKTGQLECPTRYTAQKRKKARIIESSSSESSDSSEDWEVTMDGGIGEQEEEDEESEAEDMGLFAPAVLPVICGSFTGYLYKSRFVGSLGKSIRTEERWFTPVEFVMQESVPEELWSTNILCHGKSLRFLVKKNIFTVHPASCLCSLCDPNNKDQDNDDVCYICNSGVNLVCCDECPRAFHHSCHLPTLQEDTLGDKLVCTFCVLRSNRGSWIHMSSKGALRCPVSENTVRCDYLLLRLLSSDKRREFTNDPAAKVQRYHFVISNPMWLKRVKSKLQRNKYKRVGEFVRDIELIFSNYRTFNLDKRYAGIADEMEKLFQEEFNDVFKIQ